MTKETSTTERDNEEKESPIWTTTMSKPTKSISRGLLDPTNNDDERTEDMGPSDEELRHDANTCTICNHILAPNEDVFVVTDSPNYPTEVVLSCETCYRYSPTLYPVLYVMIIHDYDTELPHLFRDSPSPCRYDEDHNAWMSDDGRVVTKFNGVMFDSIIDRGYTAITIAHPNKKECRYQTGHMLALLRNSEFYFKSPKPPTDRDS